jgi:hypothetical protein
LVPIMISAGGPVTQYSQTSGDSPAGDARQRAPG